MVNKLIKILPPDDMDGAQQDLGCVWSPAQHQRSDERPCHGAFSFIPLYKFQRADC